VLWKTQQAKYNEKVSFLLRKLGYQQMTLLQETVIPYIKKGRDIIVEARHGDGKTPAYLLPLVIGVQTDMRVTRALIVTSRAENLKQIDGQLKRLTQSNQKLHFSTVGLTPNPKREVRNLKRNPHIIAGTPDRIIDHLRRDNLNLNELTHLVLDVDKKTDCAGFEQDTHFILSKLPKNIQIVSFVHAFDECKQHLNSLIKRPLIFRKDDWDKPNEEINYVYYQLSSSNEKPGLLSDVLISFSAGNTLLLCSPKQSVKELKNSLKDNGFSAEAVQNPGNAQRLKQAFHNFQQKKADVFITTHSACGTPFLCSAVKHLIFYDLPESIDQLTASYRHLSLREEASSIILFVTEEEEDVFQTLQEKGKISMKKENLPTKNQEIKSLIQQIVKKVKEEEDPDQLNEYKKLIKKNVPIFLRGYFGAYLFKDAIENQGLLKEDMTQIFIGIGKNRKVFPRDIVQLLTNNADLSKGEIGNIKVLDNYSFAYINSPKSQHVIDKMDGIEFRGRKVTFNFARKKRDKKNNR